jgi:hypothetical protein
LVYSTTNKKMPKSVFPGCYPLLTFLHFLRAFGGLWEWDIELV